jgi:beta-glucosidase
MKLHHIFGQFLFLTAALFLTSSAVDVEKIMSSMTLREKIGQLAQYDISAFWDSTSKSINWEKVATWQRKYHFGSMLNSVFSGGSIDGKTGWNASEWRMFMHQLQEVTESSQKNTTKVPLIFGIDSIHGGTFIYGSTLFPQAINLAATFNRTHAYIQGAITGKDTRAAAIPWIFAPVLGLALTPAWARFPETFGEDPYLAAEMGASVIRGIQTVVQDGGTPRQAAACMKHFIAYSDPVNGHDRSPVMLPDRVLQQLYRPSFQAAIDAGVMTAMESYNEVGGIPMVSSKDYLQTLLRSPWRMNFTGMMVTDYQEILNLNYWHYVAASERDALELVLTDTSIDMSMIPFNENFVDQLEELVKLEKVPESRIDASVRRVLELKNDLGLFESFVPDIIDPLVDSVGSDSDWAASLQSARDSITLLKNNQNILPLSKTSTVFLTGPTCDSLVSQSGGWTFHWQGASSNEEFTKGSTVKSSLYSLIGQQVE